MILESWVRRGVVKRISKATRNLSFRINAAAQKEKKKTFPSDLQKYEVGSSIKQMYSAEMQVPRNFT